MPNETVLYNGVYFCAEGRSLLQQGQYRPLVIQDEENPLPVQRSLGIIISKCSSSLAHLSRSNSYFITHSNKGIPKNYIPVSEVIVGINRLRSNMHNHAI